MWTSDGAAWANVKNYVAPPNHYSNQKLQDVWLLEDAALLRDRQGRGKRQKPLRQTGSRRLYSNRGAGEARLSTPGACLRRRFS